MICVLVNYIMISFWPQLSVKNKNKQTNKKLARKGERFVSRAAIPYYVRTPFPLQSLLLQGLGTTQARVN